MAVTEGAFTIFVLTDTPGVYGTALTQNGVSPIFVKNVKALLERLKDVTMAGLVLEMDKVMRASRTERDRLFNYAGSFPVLRTKVNPRHGYVHYLDDKESFVHNLEAELGKRDRNHERVRVTMGCAFSAEADPSMAESIDASILDISPGGCFVQCATPPDEQFIHLRIPSLHNSRPIFSSVRWARKDGDHPLRGMGVMFIDLLDEQLDEIKAIEPA